MQSLHGVFIPSHCLVYLYPVTAWCIYTQSLHGVFIPSLCMVYLYPKTAEYSTSQSPRQSQNRKPLVLHGFLHGGFGQPSPKRRYMPESKHHRSMPVARFGAMAVCQRLLVNAPRRNRVKLWVDCVSIGATSESSKAHDLANTFFSRPHPASTCNA